jgi:hypothetical protein
MRYQVSNLYNQLWKSLKEYSSNLLRFIRKRGKDDSDFNNPFVIY